MKTLDNIMDFLTAQENNQEQHRGRYINLHGTTKRARWNNKRNYGY